METPPNFLVLTLGIALPVAVMAILYGYWSLRAMRQCDRLIDTIRTMGLAASNPLMAAKLEQQRLRQQAPQQGPHAAARAAIAAHQGAKARERQAQNSAANPVAGKPTTMRYTSPDGDLLPDEPEKEPSTPPEPTAG